MTRSYFTVRRSAARGNALVLPSGISSHIFTLNDLPDTFEIVRFALACDMSSPPSFTFKVRLYDRDISQSGLSEGYLAASAVSPEYNGGTTTPLVVYNPALFFSKEPEKSLGTLYIRLYNFSVSPGQQTQWALTLIGGIG